VATFRQSRYGWRAEVFRKGLRRSKSAFPTKAAAVAWAGRQEAEIMAGERGEVPNLTVSVLLNRYIEEVAEHKKGAKWEKVRLQAMGRDRIASVRLRTLDAPHVADWQKRRLEAVSGASVRRERNLLNHVFQIARKEWRWLTRNPFDGVRRPKDSKPRDRIASDKEIEVLTDGTDELSRIVVFALETGMRASEIASNPKVRGKVAFLLDSKTGEGRPVPLSAKAIEAYGEGFTLTAGSISTLFARRCKNREIEGLTFHDLRHTAATRLSKILDVWELAKMFGWKDLKIPLNTYYKSDPEETAKKL
jgi:integrase